MKLLINLLCRAVMVLCFIPFALYFAAALKVDDDNDTEE